MPVNIPFTPPQVSINRVRIVDLPGVSVDPEVCGRIAYQLLSAQALTDYARQQAKELDLPAVFLDDSTQTRMELPHFVNNCLSSSQPRVAAAARGIGRRLGRNLGHILLTLHRGDKVNQQARPDWTAAEWEHWRTIRKVWLGGGLVNGALGQLMLDHANAFLQANGCEDQLAVDRSPQRGEMCLVGAGRYLPPSSCQVIGLDCGHTLVKRACFLLADGVIQAVRSYRPLAVDWQELGEPGDTAPHRGKSVLSFVTNAIAHTRTECVADGLQPEGDIMLSVAAYVEQGRLLGNGIYAQMMALTKDARTLLSASIERSIGEKTRVHLIHDGTAAAALHAGESDTAVIIIGTALGVGFPPADDKGLRPVALLR